MGLFISKWRSTQTKTELFFQNGSTFLVHTYISQKLRVISKTVPIIRRDSAWQSVEHLSRQTHENPSCSIKGGITNISYYFTKSSQSLSSWIHNIISPLTERTGIGALLISFRSAWKDGGPRCCILTELQKQTQTPLRFYHRLFIPFRVIFQIYLPLKYFITWQRYTTPRTVWFLSSFSPR